MFGSCAARGNTTLSLFITNELDDNVQISRWESIGFVATFGLSGLFASQACASITDQSNRGGGCSETGLKGWYSSTGR